jgi:hypothetical protein
MERLQTSSILDSYVAGQGNADKRYLFPMNKITRKITSDPDKLLKKNESLIHSDGQKVISHVQRDIGEWILNTIMIQGYDVPFKFKRKQGYRNLAGASVNITYYPGSENVAGIEVEVMNIVRIRKS